MSVIRRIRSLVAADPTAEDRDTETTGPTYLYRCSTCERTFLTDCEMETCPRCDVPVRRTPTGTELGLL